MDVQVRVLRLFPVGAFAKANSARFSACIDLDFVSRKANDSLQPIDLRVREFMLGQGVNRSFVTKGTEPSIHELWETVVTEVLASGLANRAWATLRMVAVDAHWPLIDGRFSSCARNQTGAASHISGACSQVFFIAIAHD